MYNRNKDAANYNLMKDRAIKSEFFSPVMGTNLQCQIQIYPLKNLSQIGFKNLVQSRIVSKSGFVNKYIL